MFDYQRVSGKKHHGQRLFAVKSLDLCMSKKLPRFDTVRWIFDMFERPTLVANRQAVLDLGQDVNLVLSKIRDPSIPGFNHLEG